ncbi:MAG: HEAT repeat domain-containing protein [Sandaracinaceae bacterium]
MRSDSDVPSAGRAVWGALLLALVSSFTAPALAQELAASLNSLSAEDAAERAGAADRLGHMEGAAREQVIGPLRVLLREDGNWRVRASAGRALGRLAARDAVPDLVAALRDSVVDVRVVAAAALWRLPDPAAVPALLELLRDQDGSARQWGALALGVIGDRRATAPLIELLGDPESAVRLDAIRSLGRLGDERATRPLETVVRNDDRTRDERLEAINAVGRLSGPGKVNVLIRTLREDDATLRERAADTLGRVGDALALPPLRERRQVERTASVQRALDAAVASIQTRGQAGPRTSGTPLNLPPLP